MSRFANSRFDIAPAGGGYEFPESLVRRFDVNSLSLGNGDPVTSWPAEVGADISSWLTGTPTYNAAENAVEILTGTGAAAADLSLVTGVDGFSISFLCKWISGTAYLCWYSTQTFTTQQRISMTTAGHLDMRHNARRIDTDGVESIQDLRSSKPAQYFVNTLVVDGVNQEARGYCNGTLTATRALDSAGQLDAVEPLTGSIFGADRGGSPLTTNFYYKGAAIYGSALTDAEAHQDAAALLFAAGLLA